MEPWRTESQPVKQAALAVAITVLGVLLVLASRPALGTGGTNALAGHLLGWLLLGLGAVNVLITGKQTITVDPARRMIAIEDRNLFGASARYLAFEEIRDARIATLGRRSSGVMTYYVSLTLATGATVPLFFPAYYDGRWTRDAAEERLMRLESYLQMQGTEPASPVPFSDTLEQ